MDSSSESDEEISLKSIQYRPHKEIPKDKPKEKTPKKDVPKVEKPERQIVKKGNNKLAKITPGDEEVANKRKIILLLQYYLSEPDFKETLKPYKRINMEKKTYAELIEIKKEMDFALGNDSGIETALTIFRGGIEALEFLTVNFSPINCRGLSSRICDDPATIKDIKLIALKNCNLVQTEPEYRLAYRIIKTVMQLHYINPAIDYNNEAVKSVNAKYNDL